MKKKREVGKTYKFSYTDIPFDSNGWAYLPTYLPFPYDLVQLIVIQAVDGKERLVNGWWDGKEWEYKKPKKYDRIKCWKLHQETESEI